MDERRGKRRPDERPDRRNVKPAQQQDPRRRNQELRRRKEMEAPYPKAQKEKKAHPGSSSALTYLGCRGRKRIMDQIWPVEGKG